MKVGLLRIVQSVYECDKFIYEAKRQLKVRRLYVVRENDMGSWIKSVHLLKSESQPAEVEFYGDDTESYMKSQTS